MKRILSACLFLLLGLCTMTGCTTHKDPVSKTSLLFDTVVTITLYGNGKEELLEECFSIGRDYEQLLSRTIPTSEISQINAAHGVPVTVSDDTLELLQKGLFYSELSGGVFDITIAPASSLWDFKAKEPTVPDAAALAAAVETIDYRTVHIEGNQVWLENPDAALDLGGIAKGFIADKLKDFLVGEGITSGIINLGGNVQTIGTKPDHSGYLIGIQYPFKSQGEAIAVETITDSSLVSSGVYERYFYEGERLYHHILDPSTGYPFENNLLGVTIFSSSSVDGDGLSTTCYALGLEKGMELIESLEGVEALFITDDYELHYTGREK